LLHVSLPFVHVLLDVVFQLIKAGLKQRLIGQCSLWGYDTMCNCFFLTSAHLL